MDIGHPAAVEEITAMDDHIHLMIDSRLQSRLKILKKFNTPPPAADSWAHRQIKSEMRVGQEEYFQIFLTKDNNKSEMYGLHCTICNVKYTMYIVKQTFF
jgi:hypothetical protein